MTAESGVLPERPLISTPRGLQPREFREVERARLARQPALGLAGVTLVIPVALLLGVAAGGAERSLLVLGPLATFALPLIAMIAFWWEDWPGTMLRPAWSGWADTALVIVGAVVLTIAGQAIVGRVDVRAVFDSTAVAGHAPTFPATMPLGGAIFVAMLELTLVSEGWPLRRFNRLAAGVAALLVAWAVAIVLYLTLVGADPPPGTDLHARHGPVEAGKFGATLVCIGALQVGFYVVHRGSPFAGIASRAIRLAAANTVVIAGGWLVYLALAHGADLTPLTISALAGSAIAAGLIEGMLFEGWLDSRLPGKLSSLADVAAVAVLAALLYLGLRAFANGVGWTRGKPEEWIAHAGLNAIGAGVILHVAIGRRWPFAQSSEAGGRA